MNHKLLIVDDETANLRLLERLFSREFQCLTASSGPEAIRLLEKHDIAILITDQRMPEMTGIELLKQTALLRPHMVRILLTGYTDVEALVEAINSGLVYMYITKPWNNEDLKIRVNRACEHYENNKKRFALADANQRLLTRLEDVKTSITTALSEMLEIRDPLASKHAFRVRDYAGMIANKIGVTEEQHEALSKAALLLNLAGIEAPRFARAIADTGVEQTASRAQSEAEAKLLHSIPDLASVAEIVDSVRENYDGSGLPRGLMGEQIPLLSRILSLANEYGQMVLPGVSAAMTHEEVMRFLTQRSGKQFDPKLIEVLSHLSPETQDGSPRIEDQFGGLPEDSFEGALVELLN